MNFGFSYQQASKFPAIIETVLGSLTLSTPQWKFLTRLYWHLILNLLFCAFNISQLCFRLSIYFISIITTISNVNFYPLQPILHLFIPKSYCSFPLLSQYHECFSTSQLFLYSILYILYSILYSYNISTTHYLTYKYFKTCLLLLFPIHLSPLPNTILVISFCNNFNCEMYTSLVFSVIFHKTSDLSQTLSL